jgi:hypothetical protein
VPQQSKHEDVISVSHNNDSVLYLSLQEKLACKYLEFCYSNMASSFPKVLQKPREDSASKDHALGRAMRNWVGLN